METAAREHSRTMPDGFLSSKRKYPRLDVQGFAGDIADGKFFVAGTVEDVSLLGFKMSNLPLNFSAANRSYTTVISGNDKHYRCVVMPCWTKKAENNLSVEVGFKIIQATWEWTEFVLSAASPLASVKIFPSQA